MRAACEENGEISASQGHVPTPKVGQSMICGQSERKASECFSVHPGNESPAAAPLRKACEQQRLFRGKPKIFTRQHKRKGITQLRMLRSLLKFIEIPRRTLLMPRIHPRHLAKHCEMPQEQRRRHPQKMQPRRGALMR
jgi:hypothetical protein